MIGEPLPFTSSGVDCAGRLLLPADISRPLPTVIMAHGFAAQMSYSLEPFARTFQEFGCAVFLFDYRGFGESGGAPREEVHPRRQLDDWSAAIRFVQGLPSTDPTRMVLWGTSFSGGHVLAAAARFPSVCAVISQVPHTSGLATLRTKSIPDLIQATARAGWDCARRCVGYPPAWVKVVEWPGRFAAMNTPDAWGGYHSLIPSGHSWPNRVAARSLLLVPLYSPGAQAGRIRCPTLILGAKEDAITPCKQAERAARKIPGGEYAELPGGHFDIYQEPVRSASLALQKEFLCRRVLHRKNSPEPPPRTH